MQIFPPIGHRQSSSINIEKQYIGILNPEINEERPLSPNKKDYSMTPILGKVPRKKNTQNLKSKGIIHLQSFCEDEKAIYSGFKTNKLNENTEKENIDLKRVDELKIVRKRDNLKLEIRIFGFSFKACI